MAAQLLADMGAQVIKVESRERMDGLRLGRPMVGDDAAGGDRGLWPELQPVFHSINRNKLGVTLNLRTDEGKDLVRSLIARSDVVMNNFSPGVLGRLGLDYPDLQKLRPDIILVSMPSVGDSGPLRDILAYAPIIQALSGLMSVVGYRPEERLAEEPRAEEPLVGELQSPWSDAVASIHAGLATLAALRHRNRTGMGQKVEVAQLEATASMLGEAFLDNQMNGMERTPQGNYDADFAPHNNYPCAGDDKWVAIAVKTGEEWRGFCRALGDPAWTQERGFADRAARLNNTADLDRHVSQWTSGLSAQEITGKLQEHGVAAMPVMNIEDQFLDPHLQQREAYAQVDHPQIGTEWVYGMPWLLSETPGSVRTPAPLLGQHNEYVFHDLLGVTLDELERLRERQVIY